MQVKIGGTRHGEGAFLMRMFKTVAAAVLALCLSGALVLVAAPASAQASPCPPGQPIGRPPGTPPNSPGQPDGRPPAYPPGQCALRLSQSAAARGTTIEAQGNGFVPGETVVLSLGGREVARAIADPAGAVNTSFVVPNDAAFGRTEVTAAGQGQTLSAGFEVLAAGAADRGRASAPARAAAGLSRTGADIALMALAGAGLIAVGGAAVVTARRRRVAIA